MRRPILFPVLLSPLIGLGVLFVVGRIATVLIAVHGINREFISLFLSTVLLSILFWQGLLVYLLVSFYVALRKE
jgi:hypothetical protein